MSQFNFDLDLFWDSSATTSNAIKAFDLKTADLANVDSIDLVSYGFFGADATKPYYKLQLKFGTWAANVMNQGSEIDGTIRLYVTGATTSQNLPVPIPILNNLPINLEFPKVTATLLNPDNTNATLTTGMHLRFRVSANKTRTVFIEGRAPSVINQNMH